MPFTLADAHLTHAVFTQSQRLIHFRNQHNLLRAVPESDRRRGERAKHIDYHHRAARFLRSPKQAAYAYLQPITPYPCRF